LLTVSGVWGNFTKLLLHTKPFLQQAHCHPSGDQSLDESPPKLFGSFWLQKEQDTFIVHLPPAARHSNSA